MSEKNAEMKTERAVVVLTKVPATVTVVLNGTLIGTTFNVTSQEVDSSTVELTGNLMNILGYDLARTGTLTAFTEDEVPVRQVILEGLPIGPLPTAEELQADRDARLQRARKALDEFPAGQSPNAEGIMTLLKKIGITKVYVQYCGSGDSGQSEDVTVDDVAQAPLLVLTRRVTEKHGFWNDVTSEWDSGVREVDETIEQMLLYLCDEVVSNYHSGYENNDGGEGTLSIDTEAWTMKLTHSDFYTERDTSTTEIIPAPTLKTLGLEEDDDAPSNS